MSQNARTNIDVSIVLITRNRREETLSTLGRLRALPEQPEIIVVDNSSDDGTAEAIRAAYPDVNVIALDDNYGAAARNIGVEAASRAIVAFSDDDSWWEPGALAAAQDVFEQFPRLGLVNGRILVGPSNRLDKACAEMAESSLGTPKGMPGPALLGFVACGAIVRKEAFLTAGGFWRNFGVGGEETLLAVDMAAQGWGLAYMDDIVAHHHPSASRDPQRRRQVMVRNELWTYWLRRPWRWAVAMTWQVARKALVDPNARAGLREASQELIPVLRRRRNLPPDIERGLRQLGH